MAYCDRCKHNFCRPCRHRYFWRGFEAVKQYLTKTPPRMCKCKETE